MHVTTTGRALAAALTAARKAITPTFGTRRAVIRRDGPAAYLVASDGEVQYAERIGDADGGAAPVTYLADLATLPALKGAEVVTLTTEAVAADGVRMPVVLADDDHLPTVPAVDRPTVTIEVEGAEAAAVVAELHGVAVAAASGTDARAVLTCILVADGEAAATDTYRMHVGTVPTNGDGSTIIPARAIRAIPAGADYVYLEGDGGPASVGAGGGSAFRITWSTPPKGRTPRRSGIIAGRAVEGPYPRYRTLMPSAADLEGVPTVTTTGTLRADLAPAAKAGKAAGRFTPVILGWSDAVPGTVTADAGGVTVTIGTATTGTGTVGINPSYLADADAYVGAGATMAVRDGLRAILATNGGRTALVMPMRVTS